MLNVFKTATPTATGTPGFDRFYQYNMQIYVTVSHLHITCIKRTTLIYSDAGETHPNLSNDANTNAYFTI